MSAILDAVDRIDAISIRAAVLALAIGSLGEADEHDRLADFAGQIANELGSVSRRLSDIAQDCRS